MATFRAPVELSHILKRDVDETVTCTRHATCCGLIGADAGPALAAKAGHKGALANGG